MSNWNLKGRLHLWSSVIHVYIFPRCEAWRLKQWTINSWPTQEQGHCWEERKPKLKSNKYLRRATLKPWSITKIQQNCYKKYTEKPREFQFPSLKLLSMTKLICKLFTITLPWRFFPRWVIKQTCQKTQYIVLSLRSSHIAVHPWL